MKVKSESEVVQLCPTLSDPRDCSLPGSSAHGIFQARVLEWGAIAFSGVVKYVEIKSRDFPRSPVAKTPYVVAWVRPLIRELDSICQN